MVPKPEYGLRAATRCPKPCAGTFSDVIRGRGVRMSRMHAHGVHTRRQENHGCHTRVRTASGQLHGSRSRKRWAEGYALCINRLSESNTGVSVRRGGACGSGRLAPFRSRIAGHPLADPVVKDDGSYLDGPTRECAGELGGDGGWVDAEVKIYIIVGDYGNARDEDVMPPTQRC